MKRLTILLATRYIRGSTHKQSISTMILICFLAMVIGVFSLTLVTAVMSGFQYATHAKIKGIQPTLTMQTHEGIIDIDQVIPIIKTEFPQITAISPATYEQIIVQSPEYEEQTTAVQIKAIDPATEHLVNEIEHHIVSSNNTQKTIEANVYDDYVLIGSKLAQNLDLFPGDPITLYFASNGIAPQSRSVKLSQETARIGGIFDVGIEEIDNNLIISSISFLKKLFPESGPTQLQIHLAPGSNEEYVAQQLRQRFGLDVYSWKDMYPGLVAALKLEKYAMFLVLALITLVACMNIISLLFMYITQKQSDIAILKALGASNRLITQIFIDIGVTISVCASCVGLVSALIVGWLLDRYQLIQLPDTYYISYLPVHFEPIMLVLIILMVLLITFLASWLPAHRTRTISIASVLRAER